MTTSSRRLIVLMGVLLGLSACADGGERTRGCEPCLAGGGTWQPEVEACTVDCALMDISCFRDTCPPPCAEDCAGCFSEAACEAEGCRWQREAEAAWCLP